MYCGAPKAGDTHVSPSSKQKANQQGNIRKQEHAARSNQAGQLEAESTSKLAE